MARVHLAPYIAMLGNRDLQKLMLKPKTVFGHIKSTGLVTASSRCVSSSVPMGELRDIPRPLQAQDTWFLSYFISVDSKPKL